MIFNKLKLIGILVIALLILGASLLFLVHRNKILSNNLQREYHNYHNLSDSLIVTQDKLGRSEFTVKKLTLTKSELINSHNKELTTINKELALSKVKVRNLKSVIYINQHHSNSGATHIDTIILHENNEIKRFQHISITDSALTLEIKIDSLDSVFWNYTYIDKLLYWIEMKPSQFNAKTGKKRKRLWIWLFPKKEPVIKIKSLNPKTRIEATEVNIL